MPSRLFSHLSSWVMLRPSSSTTKQPYTPLPNEQTLYMSTPRIGLSITTPASPTYNNKAFSLSSQSGLLYLTTHRIIYIPSTPTPQLQTFAAPILSLHDSHVAAPWFGANVWTALLQPTVGGGIPVPERGVVELRLTFKEGGAFDFSSWFERVRERMVQVREMGGGRGGEEGGNWEELPEYRERGEGPLIAPVGIGGGGVRRGRDGSGLVPSEAPPGYEEVQGRI